MATVPLNLYVRFTPGDPVDSTHNRLMFDKNGGTPHIPQLNPGDTIALKIYYYDEAGGPSTRYPGSVTTVRLRAHGNNTIYATGASGSEVPPPVPSVSRVQAGGHGGGFYGEPGTLEIQNISFDATPGGHFQLVFTAPSAPSGPSGVAKRFPVGTTPNIPAGASASEIETLINAAGLSWYSYTDGVVTPVSGSDATAVRLYVSNWMQYKGFRLTFGALEPAINWFAGGLPLISVNEFFGNPWGWNVSLPLDGNGHTFDDLFLEANGPPYIEVFINNGFVAQHLLPSSVSPSAPVANFISDKTAITVGDYIAFSDVSTNSPTSRSWDFGDGQISTAQNPSHQYNSAGTYAVKLTVSNAVASSEITRGGFVVSPVSVPVGGIGPVASAAGVFYDGNYDTPHMVGTVSISHGIPDDSSSLVWRQRYQQRAAFWQPLPIGGGGCPFNAAAIAVDETPLEWLGVGDVVEFERVWALKPNPRQRPGSYAKTYKTQAYITTNGQPDSSTYSIASRTAVIGADYKYQYFNIVAEGIPIPAMMDISVVHMGPFHYYELYGGFPPPTANVAGSNHGYTLIGVDTRPYMGPIWERVLIYGQ